MPLASAFFEQSSTEHVGVAARFLALCSLEGHFDSDGEQGSQKSIVENEPLFDGALEHPGLGRLASVN